MSQYLGRGAKSRGRMTITRNLNTAVTTVPYLQDPNDVEAVIKGIENLQAALADVPGIEWQYPPPGVSAREYVEDVCKASSLPIGRTVVLTFAADGCLHRQPTCEPLDR